MHKTCVRFIETENYFKRPGSNITRLTLPSRMHRLFKPELDLKSLETECEWDKSKKLVISLNASEWPNASSVSSSNLS